MLQRFKELCVLPEHINVIDVGKWKPCVIIRANQQLHERNLTNRVLWYSSLDMNVTFRKLTAGGSKEEFALLYYSDNYMQITRSSLENANHRCLIRARVLNWEFNEECVICFKSVASDLRELVMDKSTVPTLIHCEHCSMCVCSGCALATNDDGKCPLCKAGGFGYLCEAENSRLSMIMGLFR